jgi:hypothetical protein
VWDRENWTRIQPWSLATRSHDWQESLLCALPCTRCDTGWGQGSPDACTVGSFCFISFILCLAYCVESFPSPPLFCVCVCVWVLVFEPRALSVLGRCCIAWAMPLGSQPNFLGWMLGLVVFSFLPFFVHVWKPLFPELRHLWPAAISPLPLFWTMLFSQPVILFFSWFSEARPQLLPEKVNIYSLWHRVWFYNLGCPGARDHSASGYWDYRPALPCLAKCMCVWFLFFFF